MAHLCFSGARHLETLGPGACGGSAGAPGPQYADSLVMWWIFPTTIGDGLLWDCDIVDSIWYYYFTTYHAPKEQPTVANMRKISTWEIPSWEKHEILSKVLTFHTMSLMCKNCWVSWSGSRWCFGFFFLQDLKLSKACKSMELDLRVSRLKPGITPCCVPVVRVGWQSPLTPLAKVEKISSSHSQHTKRNLCTSVVDQHPRDLQAETTNYWILLSFMLQNFAIHGNRIKSADCSTNGKRSAVLREIMQSVGRDLSIISESICINSPPLIV